MLRLGLRLGFNFRPAGAGLGKDLVRLGLGLRQQLVRAVVGVQLQLSQPLLLVAQGLHPAFQAIHLLRQKAVLRFQVPEPLLLLV